MRWKIVPANAHDRKNVLSSSELVGVSIMLANYCGEPYDDMNVYWRAYKKIHPAVQQALSDN